MGNTHATNDEQDEKGSPELKTKVGAYTADDIDKLLDEVHDAKPRLKGNDDDSKNDKDKNILYVPMVEAIDKVFVERKQLAKGGTCRVLLAASAHDDSRQYALKEMSTSDPVNELLFAKEVQLLQMLKENRHVVDFYGAYQTQSFFYIASSFCRGGTFLDRIVARQQFSEKAASLYIAIIVSTVRYMHERNIVHRDLKLNNMLFDGEGDDTVLKLIDFGDGDIVQDRKVYKGVVGTLHYLAPECTRARKGWEVKKSDLWCIGVITYILLTGVLPFSGADEAEVFAKIKKAKFKFPEHAKLSASAKSFISGLLCKKTAKRMSAQEAMEHEWIKLAETTCSGDCILGPIRERLQSYNYGGKLHKILTNVLFDELGENDQRVLREAFDTLGIGDKFVSNDQVAHYLKLNGKVAFTSPDAADQSYDSDVSESEESGSDKTDIDLQQLKLSEVLAHYDDKSQSISVATFKKLMSKSAKRYNVSAIALDLDPAASGKISLQDIQKYNKSVKSMKTLNT